MLNRNDFMCVLKVQNDRDRCRSARRLFQAHGLATEKAQSLTVERHIAGTRTSAVDVVDDASLCLTAVGSTRTHTVVLLRLASGALERKVCTGCVQAHAASAGSRAVTSHGRTCAHQPCLYK